MKPKKQHLAILDILRAVAALTVCLFHFNRRGDDLISQVLNYGHYGVEVFFIISGFIIPLAMFWSRFEYRDSAHFLIRRGLRLYPVFAIVAVFHLLFATFGFPLLGYGGGSPDLTWSRALANFTLTADLTSESWYLPIFWTLSIEAQYYLCIVATFPFLISKNKWVQISALSAWIVPTYAVVYAKVAYGQTVLSETIFIWTAFFCMGILAFLKKQQLIGAKAFWILLLLAANAHQVARNTTSASIGVTTVLLILYAPPFRWKVMEKIGVVSYSLYLLHLIFGSAVLILIRQLPDAMQWAPLNILLATLVSIGSAMLFYRYLELPFHRMAREFKTRSREKELGRAPNKE